MRSKIRSGNPDMHITDVMRTIAKEWGQLSDSAKAPFTSKADKAKAIYDKKNEKYKASSHYAKHQAAVKEWKKTQAQKPFHKDPNRPKKGLSAYLIFVNDKRASLTEQGFGITEITKEA